MAKKPRWKHIIKRDGSACVKCGRTSPLQVHHIISRLNGGSDDDANLVTLCEACHMEWHMVELGVNISFEDWLPLPTANHLIMAYLQWWNGDVSAADMQRVIGISFEFQKNSRRPEPNPAP